MRSDPSGRTDPAEHVSVQARAYLADRTDPAARAALVRALHTWSFARPDDVVDQALCALAVDDGIDHQRLIGVAVRRLLAAPAVAVSIRRLEQGGTLVTSEYRALTDALDHALNLRILSDSVFASIEVEVAVGALRSRWLRALASGDRPYASNDLLSAVALQMQTTEWVYRESEDDSALVAALAERISDVPQAMEPEPTLVYATYRPLTNVPRVERKLRRVNDPTIDKVVRRHFDEPREEQAIGATIPQLTEIRHPISRAVQNQYQERPYPKWRHAPRPTPRPVGAYVARAVADPVLATILDISRPQVLIAGCGTGRHVAATALRYPESTVMAIDLSGPALAFAARQIDELGIRNVEFAQADILELVGWDNRFDVVECVGVLHHLADPEAGWAVLRNLVQPSGLMKIGLYSVHGRSLLDPVAELIRQRDLVPDSAGVREIRDIVRGWSVDHPVRRLASTPDFYSLSGCRDLFFHTHEDRFDIPRIQRALGAMDLDFLGFEFPARRMRTMYERSFPEDPDARDLDNWDTLERMHPLLFVAMYRFWVRAPV